MRQLQFMKEQDKGYASEQTLIIKGPGIFESERSQRALISLKHALKGIASVGNVTSSEAIRVADITGNRHENLDPAGESKWRGCIC
jgi:hypothetical protein